VCLFLNQVHAFLLCVLQTHEEEMTVLRVEFMQRSTEIEQKYEKKLKTLREELDLKWRTALHEVEERKNTQINALMRNHEKAFGDIKNYYNDITLNNLSLINTLKVRLRY
jgi:phage gp36-like protein